MKNYRNVLIFGYSKSGKAVEKILISHNVEYKIFDDNMRLGGGKYIFKLTKKEIAKFDLIIISPAISIFNKYVVYAEKIGIRVISELEFGFLNCPYKIIAVTGTNGKTTTTCLINHVLNASGYKSVALGNVGDPLSLVVNYSDLDYVVTEVSSFQLEASYKFKPDIGIILNIDSDHIDRHKTLDNYINLKIGMFKNCNENQVAILNYERNILKNINKINATKLFINSDIKCVDGKIYLKNELLFNLDEIKNPTFIDNILASIAVFKTIGISNQNIIKGINSYQLPKHRMEFVNLIDGVEYINDSKATNPHATMAAVEKINKDIILLLGGHDKDISFEPMLKKMPSKVKTLICFGECRKKINKLAKKLNLNSIMASNLESAVIMAKKLAISGQTVLLSPACSSFDEFSSYKERGVKFAKIVNVFLNNQENNFEYMDEIC